MTRNVKLVLGASVLVASVLVLRAAFAPRGFDVIPSGVGEAESSGWIPRGLIPILLPRWGGRSDWSCWPIRSDYVICRRW